VANYTWYPIPSGGSAPAAPNGYQTFGNGQYYTFVKTGTKTMPTAPSTIPPASGVTLSQTGKPVKSAAGTSAQSVLNQFANDAGKLGTTPASAGSGTGSGTPFYTKKFDSEVIPFTLPHQKPDFLTATGLTMPSADGGTEITGTNWGALLSSAQGSPGELTKIQTLLHNAGYLATSWAKYGTLDQATITAWEQLGKDAAQTNIPGVGKISAATLLASGLSAKNLVSNMTSIQGAIDKARLAAASATNSNVTLTDPNKVAQSFATAMESMGMGAPSEAQTKKFVDAFISGPQGEIAATQNQADAQKANITASAGNLQGELNATRLGNIPAANNAAAMPGPVTVATKAQPNLDAESVAAAKAQNPGMYYATGTTYLYGLIQRALAGGLQVPTSPTSPSSTAPGGAIVTAPIAGTP